MGIDDLTTSSTVFTRAIKLNWSVSSVYRVLCSFASCVNLMSAKKEKVDGDAVISRRRGDWGHRGRNEQIEKYEKEIERKSATSGTTAENAVKTSVQTRFSLSQPSGKLVKNKTILFHFSFCLTFV